MNDSLGISADPVRTAPALFPLFPGETGSIYEAGLHHVPSPNNLCFTTTDPETGRWRSEPRHAGFVSGTVPRLAACRNGDTRVVTTLDRLSSMRGSTSVGVLAVPVLPVLLRRP
jgi:hypothetical protein